MLSECSKRSSTNLQKKAAALADPRDGGKKTYKSTPIFYRSRREKSTADFDLDRLDRVLTGIGDEVADQLQALGFDERDAYQAARAAMNAATERLLQVCDRMEGGAA